MGLNLFGGRSRTGTNTVFRKGVPNPASIEALKMGCRCPVFDNNNGNGVKKKGRVSWKISKSCKIHSEGPDNGQ
jgi:hypothetical protein